MTASSPFKVYDIENVISTSTQNHIPPTNTQLFSKLPPDAVLCSKLILVYLF